MTHPPGEQPMICTVGCIGQTTGGIPRRSSAVVRLDQLEQLAGRLRPCLHDPYRAGRRSVKRRAFGVACGDP